MIFRHSLLYREPSKEHLTSKGFPGFVVEFNIYNIHLTTNPGQTKVTKWSLGIPLLYREPPKEHLTAKCFPGSDVEFNTYNIPAVKSPVTYHSLAGRTSYIFFIIIYQKI